MYDFCHTITRRSSNIAQKIIFAIALPVFSLMILAGCKGDGEEPDPVIPDVPAKIEFTGGQEMAPVIKETGGTSTVNFTATEDWSINISEGATGRTTSWISVEPMSGKAGAAQVTISAQPNDSYDERNAVVTISTKGASTNITVSQKQKDALLVSSSKIEVGSAGEDFNVEVKANVSVSMEIAADASAWLHRTDGTKAGTRALTSRNYAFHADANPELTPREGQIRFRGEGGMEEIVSVFQKAAAPSIVLTQTEYIVPAAGQQVKVEIASNTEFEVEMPAETWLREVKTRAQSSYTLWFEVDENPDFEPREAVVRVVNKEHGISQEIRFYQLAVGVIVAAKESYTLSPKGGTLDIDALSNVEFTVSVSESWIRQIEPKTRGVNTYVLSFEYDAYENATEPRNAIITITSVEDNSVKQEIEIVQEARTLVDVQYKIIPAFRMISFIKDKQTFECFGQIFDDDEHENLPYFFISLSKKETYEDGTVEYYDQSVYLQTVYDVDTGGEICVTPTDFVTTLMDGQGWYDPVKPEKEVHSCGKGNRWGLGHIKEYLDPNNPNWLKREFFSLCEDHVYGDDMPLSRILKYGIHFKEFYGRTWSVDYSECSLGWAQGLTHEQFQMAKKYFGRDNISWDDLSPLTAGELIKIFHTGKYSNPLLDLPYGWYAKLTISRSDRGIKELAPSDAEEAYVYGLTNYVWDEFTSFAIMPDANGVPVFITQPECKREEESYATIKKAWSTDVRTCVEVKYGYSHKISFGDTQDDFPSRWVYNFSKEGWGLNWEYYTPTFKMEQARTDSVMFYNKGNNFNLGVEAIIKFPFTRLKRNNEISNKTGNGLFANWDDVLEEIGGWFKDEYNNNPETMGSWNHLYTDRGIFEGGPLESVINDTAYVGIVSLSDIPSLKFSAPSWITISDKIKIDYNPNLSNNKLVMAIPFIVYPNEGDNYRVGEFQATANFGGKTYYDALRLEQTFKEPNVSYDAPVRNSKSADATGNLKAPQTEGNNMPLNRSCRKAIVPSIR